MDDYEISESFQHNLGLNAPLEGYNPEANGQKPRVLLVGLQRSGKSSLQKVVFHKLSPNETMFLESTVQIERNDLTKASFVHLEVWDTPGQMDLFDPSFDSSEVFSDVGAVVYVLDSSEPDLTPAINKFVDTVARSTEINPGITFALFLHKADALSEDHKLAVSQDVSNQVAELLAEQGLVEHEPSMHLTSIYDHTVFEAFSKVVQSLMPQLHTLEKLLDNVVTSSNLEKAFLFDVVSKIYLATDPEPVDMHVYELCSDVIDIALDVSCIYGLGDQNYGMAFDEESTACVRLSSGMVLYLKEISKHLAVVCLVREEHFRRRGLLDYNLDCLKAAVQKTFSLNSSAPSEETA